MPQCGHRGGVCQPCLQDLLEVGAVKPRAQGKFWYEGVQKSELTSASDADTACPLTAGPAPWAQGGGGWEGRWAVGVGAALMPNVHSCCRAWWVTAWTLGSNPDMLLSVHVASGKLASEARSLIY